MVLNIYRRFSESTNFCSKERLLRPVTMMLGHVTNRQPVLFHSHPGQVYRWLYTYMYSPMFCIEFVSKLSRQSVSPSTDHQFNLWSVDSETDCRDNLLTNSMQIYSPRTMWAVSRHGQTANSYGQQVKWTSFVNKEVRRASFVYIFFVNRTFSLHFSCNWETQINVREYHCCWNISYDF